MLLPDYLIEQAAALKAAFELTTQHRPRRLGLFDNLQLCSASLASEATMMPARLYNNQRWTDADDQLLRLMRTSGKSLTLITAKLKRPMNAIRARAEDLHINIPGTEIAMRRGGIDWAERLGTNLVSGGFRNIERFTFSITDLDDYESEPVTLELAEEEAIAFAMEMAGEVLKSEPRLKLEGICVALFDDQGAPIPIVPLDTLQIGPGETSQPFTFFVFLLRFSHQNFLTVLRSGQRP